MKWNREDSALVIDGVQSVDFFQCCHCGSHIHKATAAADLMRGKGNYEYCTKCDGVFCAPKCRKCVPFEQQLDNMESGRSVLADRPAMIQVPRSV